MRVSGVGVSGGGEGLGRGMLTEGLSWPSTSSVYQGRSEDLSFVQGGAELSSATVVVCGADILGTWWLDGANCACNVRAS